MIKIGNSVKQPYTADINPHDTICPCDPYDENADIYALFKGYLYENEKEPIYHVYLLNDPW